MSQSIELDDKDPEFHWGTKRGIGGAKKDIQFYESFKFDGVDYSLYDCVYLFKKNETEPYIGKIVKIWEQPDGKKKVKILWFFHPNEIMSYLGDHETSEKEIFLASGDGVGQSDLNALEAIAGKCYVVCTSKDVRNLQPSKEALEMADYIFYRTFDVGNCTISDKIADKIVGIEVKYLLNRDVDLKPNLVSNLEANGVENELKKDRAAILISKPDSLKSPENKVNDEKVGQITSPKSKSDVIKENYLNEGKHPYDEKSASKLNHDLVYDGEKECKDVADQVEANPKSSKKKALTSSPDDKPSKKMRPSDDSFRLSGDQPSKTAAGTRKLKIYSDEDDIDNDNVRLHKDSSEKVKHSEKKMLPAVSPNNDAKINNKIVEVTRKPDADRSKWFKAAPWDSRIQNSDGKGTLVLLENLDPSYTSGEIEVKVPKVLVTIYSNAVLSLRLLDIIYSSFKQSCSAKVIQQGTFQNPHYGQAYIIFKTSDAAEEAVHKINTGCLMLPDGRALLASRGMLKLPPKSSTHIGHLAVDKIKLIMHDEWKKAVATSHCSQPNTIEYEMAMEWMLLQEKYVSCFNQLHKSHEVIRNQGKQRLKAK